MPDDDARREDLRFKEWYALSVMTGNLLTLNWQCVRQTMGWAGFSGLSGQMFAPVEVWWREAKMWTLMYRGGLLAGACGAVVRYCSENTLITG